MDNQANDKVIKPRYGNCPGVDEIDFIGSYGSPNTYTANLPESVRHTKTRPDSVRRISHTNPNVGGNV